MQTSIKHGGGRHREQGKERAEHGEMDVAPSCSVCGVSRETENTRTQRSDEISKVYTVSTTDAA